MENDIDARVSRCERAIFMIAAAVHEAVLLALKDMDGDAAGNDDGDGGEGAAETPAPVADKFPLHPSVEYTYDEVAAVITEHVNSLGATETSRILAQFKASRLTDLVPSQYPALVEALRKNMAEKADEKSGDENALL